MNKESQNSNSKHLFSGKFVINRYGKSLRFPLVIVNFKAYEEAIGDNALKLAKICAQALKSHKIGIAAAVQSTDIFRLSKKVKLPVFAQHFDTINPGHFTGSLPIESIVSAGACGSLINHSEHPMPFVSIKLAVEKSKSAGIFSVVCVPSLSVLKRVLAIKPDIVALEFPELIASKISISEEAPDIIRKAALLCDKHGIPFLCGGGVHSIRDARKAIEEKSDGVLISSGIVKARNPLLALENICRGIEEGLG